MSGHSKWSQIKRQKGITDNKRGMIFTKLGHLITIAAKEGGGDTGANFKLRLCIENAKKSNMPKENIERAIKRGTGELKGEIIEEIIYEAFAPAGIVFIINALTDNKNRTIGDLRRVLHKYNVNLGGTNSVAWMFEKRGIIKIINYKDKIKDLEQFELDLIEKGAEDIQEEGGELTICTKPEDLQKVREHLENKNINLDYAEVELDAKNKIKVDNLKLKEKIENFCNELDELEDINDYYTNSE
ncbi:MAG: hypothetical protein Athens101410_520 [Parcubacteria group bacterium Athens1014_10]|nr:MAG: hypothetical protein Athens101410_520 [Parcubacteria group bacterium Athens1014_10]TSD05446.1 MAG: hypothetical protein Athens071412_355 [Parcubacteria group bacterium Athens0714_12]